MTSWLVPILVALIAGPASIFLKGKLDDRKLRRQVDAEQPSRNAEQKREDFKEVTSAYRRLLKGVEEDLKEERALRAADKRECTRAITQLKRESAHQLHAVRVELLREIARLEGQHQQEPTT